MFFILCLIVIIVFAVLILNSKIQVRIYDLDISTLREEKIKDNLKTYIDIILFRKLKLFTIDIQKNIKKKKINSEMFLKNALKAEKTLNKKIKTTELLKGLKNFKFELKKLNLELEIGTEDAALTAISVGTIISILSIILRNQTPEKRKFRINPLYIGKNILNIKLDCIFTINLIHYIYANTLKRRDKNERKSSDRRAYAYSNE